MRNFFGKLEIAANVATILVAVLLGSGLTHRYFYPAPISGAQQPNKLQNGSQLQLAGVDWNQSDKTLVLVLSTTCKFCIESTSFYQRLSSARSGRSDLRLFAVLPQTHDESSKYLSAGSILVDGIQNARPSDLQVNGTPTLILVDHEGKVVNSWVGKLPPEKEAEVFSTVFGNSADL